MKKLSLILLLASLFVCAFAITVSAAEIPEWTDVIELDGMADKTAFGADGAKGATSRVLMDDGKTYPAYYICKNQTTLGISFTDINKATGITYAAANVVRLEIPNGITTLAQMANYSKLVSVVVPEGVTDIVEKFLFELATVTDVTLPSTIKTISSMAFYEIGAVEEFVIPQGCETIKEKAFKCAQIKSVIIPASVETIEKEGFYECKGLTKAVCGADTIGSQAFKNCAALEELTLTEIVEIGEQAFYACGPIKHVDIPSTCTTINALAFKNAQILSITVPSSVTTIGRDAVMNCVSLKEINHHAKIAGSYMYRDCSAVERLNIEGLETAETYSFYGLSSLKTINLPETLTTVGDFSFSKLGVETLVTPVSLVNIGKSAFYSSSTVKRVIVLGSVMSDSMFASCSNLYDVAITSRLTTFNGNPFNSSPQNSYTIYFAGNDYEAVRTLTKSNVRFNGSLCAYSDFKREDYGTKNVFVYGADICAMYFDGHVEDNNSCMVNCTRCAISGVAEKNPVHNEIVTMIYAGFDKAGERASVCTNKGCQYKVAEAAEPLFVDLGHSAPTFVEGAITLGYSLNNKAIQEYEKVTGKTLSYGIFAVLEERLEGDVVNADGTLAKNVIGADVSKYNLGAFELKITGFVTDNHKNAKIIYGAYVIAQDDDGKEISYMQAGVPTGDSKYYSASYNDIVNK